MNSKIALIFVGAVLCAQPPANFEASVKAAMAPSLAQQRSAAQKQAAVTVPGDASAGSSSFFTTPFPPVQPGVVDCDPLPTAELDSLIESASGKAGVDRDLVRAVVDKESAGRPCALSARGAQGLMQLMPETAGELNVLDAFDPKENIEGGARLLKSLLNRYNNDASLALGAYNAGSTRVDEAGGVPKIPETVDYVTTILDKIKALSGNTGSRNEITSK